MLSPVSAADASSGVASQQRQSDQIAPHSLESQLQEIGAALERSKRDLAAAFARAERQSQRAAEAKQRIEQLRWMNNNADANPDLARQAAASIAAQSALIEAAEKSSADMAVQITRLQTRIDRQVTRLFDLQSRHQQGVQTDQTPGAAQTERPAHDKGAQADDASRAAEIEQALLDQLMQMRLRAAAQAEFVAQETARNERRRAQARASDQVPVHGAAAGK